MNLQKSHTVEESMLQIRELSKKGPVKVRDLLRIFGGRGGLLLIIFLVIPFCLPIQIPGLSTPFGLAILFIGLRMAFRHKIWLTEGILEHEIKPKNLNNILNWGFWFMEKLNPITCSRFQWICNTEYLFHFHCIMIAVLALILALPLPIPLSNLSAAWAIFLICLGLIKQDGLLTIIGYILAAITFLVFIYLFFFFKTHLLAYFN